MRSNFAGFYFISQFCINFFFCGQVFFPSGCVPLSDMIIDFIYDNTDTVRREFGNNLRLEKKLAS